MAVVRNANQGLHAADLGATLLQLRDPDATVRALERETTRLVAEAQVPVVVSARVDLALAAGAAGAHLPEADIAVAAARRLLGDARLVGRSVHSVSAALEAEAQGADYVVFGPVFGSASHPDRAPAGLESLSQVARAVTIPVLAIGGVDATRTAACADAGAAGFAAIGYFGGR
jgi:thiamine-phosphate pyrophosphorylase